MNPDNNQELEFVDEEVDLVEDAPVEELRKITSYNVANTIEVLKLKIDDQEINLKPEFQRDFVWDINRASLFIDSLIIGLPIPSIFLGKNREDESFMVIDGQQRLKSAYFFLKGEFENNGETSLFTLKGLRGREWNDKSFAELNDKHKKRIKNAVINTTIIEDIDSHPQVVHDLFHRLNTGGMPLTDQEIRNCVYSGSFNIQLLELNRNYYWRRLMGTEKPDKRLRDVELILRYFALYYSLDTYKPSMKYFLSKFQDDNKKKEDFIDSNRSLFEYTVQLIHDNIGPHAFRTTRAINKSITDAIMVSLTQIHTSGQEVFNIRENYERITSDPLFRRYTQSGTSSETNVKGRIDLSRNYFLGLM